MYIYWGHPVTCSVTHKNTDSNTHLCVQPPQFCVSLKTYMYSGTHFILFFTLNGVASFWHPLRLLWPTKGSTTNYCTKRNWALLNNLCSFFCWQGSQILFSAIWRDRGKGYCRSPYLCDGSIKETAVHWLFALKPLLRQWRPNEDGPFHYAALMKVLIKAAHCECHSNWSGARCDSTPPSHGAVSRRLT